MQATRTDAIADRLAGKFDLLDVARAGASWRVYVEHVPVDPRTTIKWCKACGVACVGQGWDGRQYVTVRDGKT
jgi:hypothetical protein